MERKKLKDKRIRRWENVIIRGWDDVIIRGWDDVIIRGWVIFNKSEFEGMMMIRGSKSQRLRGWKNLEDGEFVSKNK